MNVYKCTIPFEIEMCDDNGFFTENDFKLIEKDSVWYISEDNPNYRLIGGEVRLESDNDGWIEITNEHLKDNFEMIEGII